MDRLASCYFCGAALDAALDEYPVVPRALAQDAERRQTVVLCQTCREKLGPIVESVMEAASTREARTDAAAAGDGDGEDGSGTADGDGDAGDRSGTPDADENADEFVSKATDAGDARSDPLAGPDGSESAASTDDARPAGPSEDATAEATGDGPAAGAAGDGSASEAMSESPNDASLTALEFNKVLRLLQNRELPVDRAEFRDLATGAYDITDDEFDAVVDAAVSRGLLDEADGQLVRAE